MKNDIQDSCVEIPVLIDMYVALLDQLRKQHMDCGPDRLVASIIQKYLDGNSAEHLQQRSEIKPPEPDWTNDWIMFGEPPAMAESEAPGSGTNPEKQQRNDWCIGCGCPSEDLASL